MAPPDDAFACTLFFSNALNNVGWSETYYSGANTIANAKTACTAMVTARCDILTTEYQVNGFRVSSTAVIGDSLVDNTVVPGTISILTDPSVDPWSALMLRMEANSLHRGRKFIHGVPENMFKPSRLYDPAGGNAGAVTTFDAHLIANNWLLKYTKIKGPPATYNYLPLVTIFPQRMVEHKVGRPFGLLRGRR